MRRIGRRLGTLALAVAPVGAQEAALSSEAAARVDVAPRYTTAIRVPEPVRSVVIGDPHAFLAEYSEKEPRLVFVKPVIREAARTNLLISTVSGRQWSFLVVSGGEAHGGETPRVDFVKAAAMARRFLVEPVTTSRALVPRTETVPEARALLSPPAREDMAAPNTSLDGWLERQRRAPLPALHGGKPGLARPGREPVKAGVSEVRDEGRHVMARFSVVNQERHAVELLAPQVQLSGRKRQGLWRRERWVTAAQLPVLAWRLSRRKLGAGERADGVVVFERPGYKQGHEEVLLQMAESGAVDRPALAPVGFGIKAMESGEAR